MQGIIKTNSLKAWILAARPQTLSGAAVPVLVAIAMAIADYRIAATAGMAGYCSVLSLIGSSRFFVPALLCLLYALAMQIDANFINDYYDFKKGSDLGERLGPKRALTQGWITPAAMRKGIIICTIIACIIGLPLVLYGGWWLVAVGAICVIFALLYTTKFSYKGMGDILVLIFFGLVPVGFTYYVLSQTITLTALMAGFAVGVVTDNMLIINNYRDREQDAKSGKRTIVVKYGAQTGEDYYLLNGIMAVVLCVVCLITKYPWAAGLPIIYLLPHILTWRKMKTINHGKELNSVLGLTARNILIFGLLLALGFML
jgi:1,4-dihydroxy-2-naphthoate polyprenyltransferase